MREDLDKYSFILGMVTAFCECVAGGCKRMALSPPLTKEDYEAIAKEAERLIEEHGLLHFHETNSDLPEAERFEWILITARQDAIDEYQKLRCAGYSPARSLEPFYGLLSYREEESIHTGFDAYRQYFIDK